MSYSTGSDYSSGILLEDVLCSKTGQEKVSGDQFKTFQLVCGEMEVLHGNG